MSTLNIFNYTKILKNNTVLQSVSLSAKQGECIGIVGSNGSGKTMLLRAIAGLIKPTSGYAEIDRKIICKDISFPPSIGIVIENVGLWPYYPGRENLLQLAEIKHLIRQTEVDAAIRRVGLDPEDKRPYQKYSLGMKQRLAIAQAVMEKPDLLLLDEPTNALDEEGITCIRQIILEEKQRGAIIVLTSHNHDDIALLCDRVYRMTDGKLAEEEAK